MRIALIGPPGAGKTTVARDMARAFGMLHIDSDELIERRTGSPAAQVLVDQGEPAFREIEKLAIADRWSWRLAGGTEVWSLGGGAVLDPATRELLGDAIVVWLDASDDVLWERVASAGNRPLAVDRDAFAALCDLRRDACAGLASWRVDTSETDSVAAEWFEVDTHASERPNYVPPGEPLVGRGLLERAHEWPTGTDVALVADERMEAVARSIADQLTTAGRAVLNVQLLPMGEWNKQIGTVERITREWLRAGVHRSTTVIALGGGTTTDAVGFAAATFARGLEWVAVPTTLVGQVDAAIGGKTGVNVGVSKNMMGSFHQPLVVVADPDVLSTLSVQALQDGMVEAAKTALLDGSESFLDLVAESAADLRNLKRLEQLAARCAQFKEAICAEDPLDDQGIRSQLNLGHTVGHAVESASHHALSHGNAVALGLRVALELSVTRHGLDPQVVNWYTRVCETLGFTLSSPIGWPDIATQLLYDKKRDAGGISWQLLAAPGTHVIDRNVTIEEVAAAWDGTVYDPGASGARHDDPRVLVLFGVNLGDLGERNPDQYGTQTLGELARQLEEWGQERNLSVDVRQTDSIERYIDALREVRHGAYDAVVLNPGAWTHTERSLHDALEPIAVPKVEVHLSDVEAREEWRHTSVIAPVVDRSIVGRGAEGFRDALDWLKTAVSQRAVGHQRR
jgi:3-dehydroquinate synthase/shikimate kinase/3-dehydroquinate synthase